MATTEHSTVDKPQQYVDFDEYVGFHLSRTQSGIKSTEILTTLGWIGTLGLAYLLIFTVLDHWVIDGGFSRFARISLLLSAVTLGVGWFVWRVVVPYMRSINSLYAARQIEQSTPSLKGGLVNLVDLQNTNKPIPEHVRIAIEKHAALELSHVDVDQAVDRRPLMRVSYLLLVIVTACCLYALLSPKDILASVKRALLPTSATAPPTQTRITDVEPGNVTVVARESVTVKANIGGRTPEHVTLYYSTSDRKYVDEPVPMEQPDAELPAFVAELSGENGRGLLENMTYRIVAGDAETENFQITVVKPPSATVNSVAYEFPSYMEMENRTEPTGHISAHEGTLVRIKAEATIPVATAKVVFVEGDQPTGEEVRMTITDGRQLSAEWKLAIRDDGTFAPHYWIECQTEDGRADPDPTRYNIVIKPDLPPLVELLAPQRDLKMPANGIIPLAFRAADPDFRLRSVRLIAMKDGSVIVSDPLLDEDSPRKTLQGRYDWKLEPLKLTPGERLTFYLQAKDNRTPLANTKQTAKLNVDIIEPVTEEEAQQQLEEEKQKQQEQEQQQEEAEQQQDQQQQDQPKEEGQPEEGEQAEGASEKGNPEEGDSGEGEPGDEESEDGQPSDKQSESGKGGDAKSDGDDSGEKSSETQSGDSGDSGEGGQQQKRPLDPENQQDQEEALKRIFDRQKEKEQQEKQPDQKPNEKGEKQEGEKQPQPGEQSEGDQSNQQDGDSTQTGDPGQNSDSPQDKGKPQGDQPQQGDPGGENGDADANPGDNKQPENDPNSNSTSLGKGTDEPKPDTASGDGTQTEDEPDPKDPGQQDDNVQGTEEPAADDKNAKKTDATGEETGKGKAVDEQEAEEAQKKLDREGDKNEAGRKPGDPDAKPQANEQGDPNDPASDKAKPKPSDTKPSEPKNKNDEPVAKPGDGLESPPDQKSDAIGDKTDGQGEKKEEVPEAENGNTGKKGEPTEPNEKPLEKPKPNSADDAQKSDQPNEAPPSDPSQPDEKPQDPPAETPETPPSDKPEGQGGDQPGGKSGESPDGKPGDNPGDKPGDKPKGEPGKPSDGEGQPGDEAGGEKGGGKSEKPGESSSDKPGESSDQPGQESGSKPGKASESPSGETGGGASNSPQGDAASDADAANAGADGEADGDQANGKGEGEGKETKPPATAEEANLDYTKKATELVLDKIQGDIERGEVDEKLLEELGWTEEQLQEFSDRMQNKLQRLEEKPSDTPAAIAERRQFEEMLKDLNPETQIKKRSSTTENEQRIQQFDAKTRKKVPLTYRQRLRAYTRSLSKDANAPTNKPVNPKSKK